MMIHLIHMKIASSKMEKMIVAGFDGEVEGDVNINLEGRDVQMADVQTTQVIKDTRVTLTLVNPEGQQQSMSVSSRFVSNMLNPSPDTGIDSIFESTPRVDVPIMTTAELPLLSATTLPLPFIPIISHVQQTTTPSPANVPSSSLQDLLILALSSEEEILAFLRELGHSGEIKMITNYHHHVKEEKCMMIHLIHMKIASSKMEKMIVAGFDGEVEGNPGYLHEAVEDDVAVVDDAVVEITPQLSFNHLAIPQARCVIDSLFDSNKSLYVEEYFSGQKKPEAQWTADERKAANLDQRLKSLIMSVLPDDQMNFVLNCLTAKSTWDDLILYHEGPADVKESRDFQDSLDNEEDTRSSHEYLKNLEEEYQAKALLAKSKRFFKKGTQRNTKYFEAKYNKVKAKLALLSSSASALSSFSSKNKGLIAELYDWDEEDVSLDDEETEVKALITLTNEERISVGKESARNDYLCIDLNNVEEQRNNLSSKHRNLVQELNTCKEQLFVLKQAKLDLLTMQHVNTEILKENQNLKLELKELTSITKTWLNSSNKVNQCINEQIPTQKKKILGIGQLTKDTSSFGSKDLVFIKSLANNSYMSITSSNLHKSSEAKDYTLPNHNTDEVPSNKLQRNTTNPSVVVYDSLASDYDLADESSVSSTPILPLKKLDDVEPSSGPKTIKSILKSKSTFKAETLKGITINEPSLAPARDNKSSSAS
nr:retrovirus-related Pol polyprotein from transposon TNT 1-94 [Tanacetum cinerariifolium]